MSPPVAVVAHNLRVDLTSAEVLRALDEDGVEAILLKGPSTVRWLFPGEPRRYHDCDLLVSPMAIGRAEATLRELGFTPALAQHRMPSWWREHALEWVHPGRFAGVDLHRRLKGARVNDARIWEVLSTETETMAVADALATVLSAPGRALVLAVDSSPDDVGKEDLSRAIERAGDATWQRAAELARELDAIDAFSTGLRLVPAGRTLAERLGLPPASSVTGELRIRSAPAEALTVDRLARASGVRERAAIVRHKLLPPPTFMRHWSPQARPGLAGLLAAYVRRLAWVAMKTPRAVRSWRRARRAVQAKPPTGA